MEFGSKYSFLPQSLDDDEAEELFEEDLEDPSDFYDVSSLTIPVPDVPPPPSLNDANVTLSPNLPTSPPADSPPVSPLWTCFLEILDTASQTEYSELRSEFLRSCDGCLLIYDVTDEESYGVAIDIYRDILMKIPESERDYPLLTLLFGNKMDIVGAEADSIPVPVLPGPGPAPDVPVIVPDIVQVATEFCSDKPLLSSSTGSALLGTNITETFTQLLHMIPPKPDDGHRYRILILGQLGVGKSAVVLRFVRGEFVEETDPTLEETFSKVVQMREWNVEVVEDEDEDEVGLAEVQEGTGTGTGTGPVRRRRGRGRRGRRGRRRGRPQQQQPPQQQQRSRGGRSRGGFFSNLFGGRSTANRSISEPVQSEMSLHQKKQVLRKRARKVKRAVTRTRRVQQVVKKANTNVISLNIGTVTEEVGTVLVDKKPFFCDKCSACVNKFCSVKDEDPMGEPKWECNFCKELNSIAVPDLFILPEDDCVEYMLAEAPQVYTDDTLVVFVVDVSGSMSVTSSIPPGFGNINVGSKDFEKRKAMVEELNKTLPRDEQIELPRQRADRWVSRRQCMQSAVDIQLQDLQKYNPERRVVLITFSNVVTVYNERQRVRIDDEGKLNDFEFLYDFGKKYDASGLRPLSESKEVISETLFDLVENGQTALGPALVVALGIASQITDKNSEVIICTDGFANIGLGAKLDCPMTHDERITMMEHSFRECLPQQRLMMQFLAEGALCDCEVLCDDDMMPRYGEYVTERVTFFTRLAEDAASSDTSVSAIGISDEEDCDMEMMEILAQATGGSITVVRALEMQRKMREILDQEKIAKDVRVKLLCDPDFQFKQIQDEDVVRENQLDVRVGVAHTETDITAEYMVNRTKLDEARARAAAEGEDVPVAPEIKTSVPFQCQLRYTRLDGAKFLRIQTLMREVTQKREDAEAEANLAVLGQHTVKKSSHVAKKGRARDARLGLQAMQKLQFRSLSSRVEDESEYAQAKEENFNYFRMAKQLDDELLEVERAQRAPRAKKSMRDRSRGLLWGMGKSSLSSYKSSARRKVRKTKRSFKPSPNPHSFNPPPRRHPRNDDDEDDAPPPPVESTEQVSDEF